MSVKIIKGGLAVDDRGSVRFVNDFDFEGVKRFYHVENHRIGFIRAWHGHQKEAKYVYVSTGTALVGVTPLDAEEGDLIKVQKFVLSAKTPSVLYIPAGNFNGFMNLEEGTNILFFSTSTLQDSLEDDIRKNYDCWNVWQDDFR
jgi:dTDP-4-dehydrorhamnose 3,5-epimerase-like enzyme